MNVCDKMLPQSWDERIAALCASPKFWRLEAKKWWQATHSGARMHMFTKHRQGSSMHSIYLDDNASLQRDMAHCHWYDMRAAHAVAARGLPTEAALASSDDIPSDCRDS